MLAMTHFLLLGPLACLWPLTYLGSSVIVDFYDLANFWVGTVAASAMYGTIASVLIMAAIFYTADKSISSGYIWQEMVLYLVVEAFAWYLSVWEYPKAH